MEKIKTLWNKYKETITYLIAGGITTAVNYGVFALCSAGLGMGVVTANAVAWVTAVIVAFVTNKFWVFQSKSWEAKVVVREFWQFVAGRLVTLGVESLLLWIFVDQIGVNKFLMKIITNIIVLVLNYIFSKFIIFRKKKEERAQ